LCNIMFYPVYGISAKNINCTICPVDSLER
jgi:hypothetical protein